jgi:predicted DNA binding CopG/RHH family protein
MEEQMNTNKLPQTDSIQELAQFWDTHDLTDFAEELEEVAEPVFARDVVVSVPLSAVEAAAVKRMAQAKGVDSAELIHEWIAEKAHDNFSEF